jgi:serine/threonine-protein kinase
MAVVYRARDESLKREVAIKVLHAHLSAEPESKARLEREAQAVAKLKHDNILEIFDYSGSEAESSYIVTEFIEGETLKQFLARTRVRHPEVAALIAMELGGALIHAHGLGIIHRDIKPENVMIRKDGLLKLMDFGIAQVVDLQRMTVTGQLLGSPAYMAPELIEGRSPDFRTDVFSVGILLYQMATGSLPFSGKNPHEVLRRIGEGKFPDARASNRLIGTGLWRILCRALAHDAAERQQDVGALVGDLREYLHEAGLDDVRQELRGYFADPAAYEAALPARLTSALAGAADGYLTRRTPARAPGKAIECWNRVLAYEPENPTVLASLRRLEGRSRRRALALLAAGGLVLGAILVAGTEVIVRRHPPAAPRAPSPAPAAGAVPAGRALGPEGSAMPAAAAAASAPTPGPAPAAAPALGRAPAATPAAPTAGPATARAGALAPGLSDTDPGDRRLPPRTRAHAARGARAGGGDAPAAPETPGDGVRTFTLGPTPQNVDVYLNGERQFSYDTDHRTLTVPWGKTQVIEFRSPSGCCFVERVEVGPDRPVPPDDIIARKLKWRPARLAVAVVPPDPDVRAMVRDPARPGRGTVVEPGQEALVPFYPGDEGQKEIEVSVDSAAGFAAEHVVVRAGQRSGVTIRLRAAP